MASYFDEAADVGSEEEEEFDEETGEVISRSKKNGANGRIEDSSEEEDEDDDEEALRKAGEGFIVDEDEDDDADRVRRREKRKRRREREEEEALDDEDLELIGLPSQAPKTSTSKFKRLKQGHREERAPRDPHGIQDIFADEDDEMEDLQSRDPYREMDDFIEDDIGDEEGGDRDDDEVARPGRRIFDPAALDMSGMDEAAREDFNAAFYGDENYDWALAKEDDEDDPLNADGEQKPTLQLADIFEPSQLAEKFLTDEDNVIKMTDVPERFQLLRESFRKVDRSEDEMQALLEEEAVWIEQLMWPKKLSGSDGLSSHLQKPFRAAIQQVLHFFNVDNFEVPYIFQHKRDYLIYEEKIMPEDVIDGKTTEARKLLSQDDLWDVLDYDLRWQALIEKRNALESSYKRLQEAYGTEDEIVEDLTRKSRTIEELQDVQDYFNFRYSTELKDLSIASATNGEDTGANGTNGTQKRARGARNVWDRLRASNVYRLVQAFGISADDFTNNLSQGRRKYPDDPSELPDDEADKYLDPPEYQSGGQTLRAAKAMYVEELVMNPRLRRYLRELFYTSGHFHCYRTEKGSRTITDDHPYYEFKYLRNQEFVALARKPELYLRMLQAESEGLVELRVTLINPEMTRRKLYGLIQSDSQSSMADAWNSLRREVLDSALDKLDIIIAKGVKEALRSECENLLGQQIRLTYSRKLDQAPYKVAGLAKGDKPRVLAVSNGNGHMNRDAICWVYMDEDGRVLEHGKFVDLRPGEPEKYLPDGKDVAAFVDLVRKRRPDVIGVSGFTPETRKLYKDLQEICLKKNLEISETDNIEFDEDKKLQVIMVNDECARLYHTSERAVAENPSFPPIARYCVGLARYLQGPLLEYAALGKNITSISFDPNQTLLPKEKLAKWLETAMVDMVNLVGVPLNDMLGNSYLMNLLPYVAGLGPRKADRLLKAIQINGGSVISRGELLGDEDSNIVAAMGMAVWLNSAAFLDIDADESEPNADYLDHTRIHPEDYEIARKMAADALELDEEDIAAEVQDGGLSAVVRKLVKDDQADKVNDLVLEEYAEQLEIKFKRRKRATLETIRAELLTPFEEIRHEMDLMSSEEVFSMLTGETEESLVEAMIVPVTLRRVFPDHIECKLDNGLEGGIGAEHYPEGVDGHNVKTVYQSNQVVQAIIQFINKRALTCQLSLRADLLRKPYHKKHVVAPNEWDDIQEAEDKKQVEKEREAKSGRVQRVIKHPLFKPFNTAQAEEYLGSQGRGDCVIRPSSKGHDHLAVTWKVSDSVYQHIDVVELDKDNEFALGKTLVISGKHKYSDLDELIVLHVKAMAKKVDEITNDERFQRGSKKETEDWLQAYVEANPRRSMYAFCINREYPGYFNLCFKQGVNAEVKTWPIKIIPNGFEMRKNSYPDMQSLKNGFKMLMTAPRGR